MHAAFRLTALIAVLGLNSCGPVVSQTPGPARGRYAGVGIYPPSGAWTKLVAGAGEGSPDRARPADDQVIIVVQDVVSGEVRACGDLSGVCIGMNPWRRDLASSAVAPVRLLGSRSPGGSGRPAPETSPAR